MDWVQQRRDRGERVAECLYTALIKDDGGAHLARTGSLLSCRNLRTNRNKAIFRIILMAERDHGLKDNVAGKRFWTKRLLQDSVRLLIHKYKLEVPQVPGFTWRAWFKEQGSLLHGLTKKAKRNSGNTMDGLQTLPFNAEEPQHVTTHLCSHSDFFEI